MTRRANFFAETAAFQRQQTELFDFIWTTAAALWNLRWQVQGFLAVRPHATKHELESRFLLGSGVQSANFRSACYERGWSDQQEQFARQILTVLIAMYEDWADTLANRYPQPPGAQPPLAKQLQFPSQSVTHTTVQYERPGIREALRHMVQPRSQAMASIFAPQLRGLPKYSIANIDDMMICLRYFKELRNALMHSGGFVDRRVRDAYLDFSQLDPSTLGMEQLPRHRPSHQGQPIKVDLHGVVGFAGVLNRVVITVEGAVSDSRAAEQAFLQRWRTELGAQQLPADAAKHEAWICQTATSIGFPKPRVPNKLLTFLASNKLVG